MTDVASQEAALPPFEPPGNSLMISAILEIAKEYKTPFSFVLTIFLTIAVGWLLHDHVSRQDVDKLNDKLAAMQSTLVGVQCTLSFDHLDTRHHTVRTDIFNLTQHIKEETGKEDRLELQRLDELKGEETDINRKLDTLACRPA